MGLFIDYSDSASLIISFYNSLSLNSSPNSSYSKQ